MHHDAAGSIEAKQYVRARGKLGKANSTPTNWVYARLAPIARGLLSLTMDLKWHGGRNLPSSGPAIIVANHVSSLDPIVMILAISYNGRWPRILSRANLFDSKLVGWAMRLTRQIPVYRGAENASDALIEADAALRDSEVVLMYPEGTITFDELEWPMTIHTGAARLALATGAPVIPVGQWGANFVLPPRKRRRPKLGGQRVDIIFGEPVDLHDLVDEHADRQAVQEASVRILTAITQLAEQARDERHPGDVWDQKLGRRVPFEAALRGSADRLEVAGNLNSGVDPEQVAGAVSNAEEEIA